MRPLVLIMFFAFAMVTMARAQDSEKISAKSNPVAVNYNNAGSTELIPALTWISIPNTSITTIEEKTHNLKVGVKSKSEITHYTIMIDGEELSGQRGLGMASAAGPEDYDLVIERELKLENQTTHEIRVLVENEDGEATLEFRYLKVNAPVE
ncbi:MAG: hypothetical protein OEY51_02215, partial [Cyclobacteriaceae bacterium]|nr:hypothetical protein [Cyclobacteriaceae bacterium]